jgi:hypothetical protein
MTLPASSHLDPESPGWAGASNSVAIPFAGGAPRQYTLLGLLRKYLKRKRVLASLRFAVGLPIGLNGAKAIRYTGKGSPHRSFHD